MSTNPDYRDNLHKGARYSTHRNARELRQVETEAEKKLWGLLRNNQLKGKKFRRQHPLYNYVLDFYCHEHKLALELDGGIHELRMSKIYDEERSIVLKEFGVTVLRFTNEQVIDDPATVLTTIVNHL